MKYPNPPTSTNSKKKNKYSCSFFKKGENGKGQRVFFLQYVNSISKAINWVVHKNIEFDYVNVYDRRTKEYLTRYYY